MILTFLMQIRRNQDDLNFKIFVGWAPGLASDVTFQSIEAGIVDVYIACTYNTDLSFCIARRSPRVRVRTSLSSSLCSVKR